MMTEEGFNQLVDEIMALGYDEETAARYAEIIGDTPIRDQDENVVVMEGKTVIARLNLQSFKE